MTNFHSRIMNLPFDRPISSPEYATGHRDARHVAAEIANEADAIAARLAEAERFIRDNCECGCAGFTTMQDGKEVPYVCPRCVLLNGATDSATEKRGDVNA
jgi:hypothetical protein